MAVKMRPMGLRTFNNAKPKDLAIPWYDKDNLEEQKAWDETPIDEREHLHITYSREKYTAKLEREMDAQMKSGLPGSMLAVMLHKVILDWELYHLNEDEDDQSPLVLSRRDGFDKNGKYMGQFSTPGSYESEEELTIQAGDKIPLTARCLDQVCNIAGMARIASTMAEDNRPNAKKSGSSNSSF